ncbi:MAG: glycosyltransferase family 2 protein [Acidobacteriota bacterium]
MSTMLSVIISGIGPDEAAWESVQECLRALEVQDCDEPFEVLVCAHDRARSCVPGDLTETFPQVRVLMDSNESEATRKNLAVEAARGKIVAFLDADCRPERSWLRTLADVFHYYPETAVVSGEAPDSGLLGWLQRAAGRKREAGPVQFTATNNAAFRREAYLEYPLPVDAGSQAESMQTAGLRRARYVLWFEPALQVERVEPISIPEQAYPVHQTQPAFELASRWLRRIGPLHR